MPRILNTMIDGPLTQWIFLFRCIEERFPGATINTYDRPHLLLHFRQVEWHEQQDPAFFQRLTQNVLC